jgi:hypothetical protein
MKWMDNTPASAKRFSRLQRVLLLLAILLAGISAAQLLFPGKHLARRVAITMDTNGYARVFGVPLHNKRLRNGAFRTLGIMGLKAEVRLPGRIPTPTSWSNLLDTMQAISSANLLPTNASRNVYEFSYE